MSAIWERAEMVRTCYRVAHGDSRLSQRKRIVRPSVKQLSAIEEQHVKIAAINKTIQPPAR
jgi:hypothetical protein